MKEFFINTDDLIKKKIENEIDLDFDLFLIEGVNNFHFSLLVEGDSGNYYWLDLKEQCIDSFNAHIFESKYEAVKDAVLNDNKIFVFKEQRDFINWMYNQELDYNEKK